MPVTCQGLSTFEIIYLTTKVVLMHNAVAGVDTKQIHLVDQRASEVLRLTSPEQKSLAQGTIISKIHSEP